MSEIIDSFRILALDDDVVDLEYLGRLLKGMKGKQVHFSAHTTSKEALRELRDGSPYDVLIVDYMLGIESGLEVIDSVHEIDPELPVILLTGRIDKLVMAEVVRADVSDFISKCRLNPVNIERSVTNATTKGRLRREIRQQRQDLERLVADLEKREEENVNFYHVLSHELKTPLTAIREFVAITMDGLAGEVNAEQAEYLGVALRNCDHLKGLLNDLFDVTRCETGKMAIQLQEHSIEDWIRHGTLMFGPVAAKKEIGIDLHIAPELPAIKGDPERLLQVLTNLLSNAIKFTDNGGTITVRAELSHNDPQSLAVSVLDTGCGLSRVQSERVFDRLYQTNDENFSIMGGLGLGLHLCQELIRSHGGRIWVDSEPGQGSCFTFTIPIAKQPTELQSSN